MLILHLSYLPNPVPLGQMRSVQQDYSLNVRQVAAEQLLRHKECSYSLLQLLSQHPDPQIRFLIPHFTPSLESKFNQDIVALLLNLKANDPDERVKSEAQLGLEIMRVC